MTIPTILSVAIIGGSGLGIFAYFNNKYQKKIAEKEAAKSQEEGAKVFKEILDNTDQSMIEKTQSKIDTSLGINQETAMTVDTTSNRNYIKL